jgi:hypothetical protein
MRGKMDGRIKPGHDSGTEPLFCPLPSLTKIGIVAR